jgi:hypothetical protein
MTPAEPARSESAEPSRDTNGLRPMPARQTHALMPGDPRDHIREIERGEDIAVEVQITTDVGAGPTRASYSGLEDGQDLVGQAPAPAPSGTAKVGTCDTSRANSGFSA